jgi:hypothetical protein
VPGLTLFIPNAAEASPLLIGNLRRVIPIAATAHVGGTVLTFLSLEEYDDGFLLNGSLQRPTLLDPPYRAEATLNVADSRGTKYEARSAMGHGDEAEWRFTLHFIPPLDPTCD